MFCRGKCSVDFVVVGNEVKALLRPTCHGLLGRKEFEIGCRRLWVFAFRMFVVLAICKEKL
jgi:hypothetical protein